MGPRLMPPGAGRLPGTKGQVPGRRSASRKRRGKFMKQDIHIACGQFQIRRASRFRRTDRRLNHDRLITVRNLSNHVHLVRNLQRQSTCLRDGIQQPHLLVWRHVQLLRFADQSNDLYRASRLRFHHHNRAIVQTQIVLRNADRRQINLLAPVLLGRVDVTDLMGRGPVRLTCRPQCLHENVIRTSPSWIEIRSRQSSSSNSCSHSVVPAATISYGTCVDRIWGG